MLWRKTDEDGPQPFTNYTLSLDFKEKKNLKDIDFDFDSELITNFNAPKKLKAKIEAKCQNGHVMPERFTTRPRNCGWVCNGCREHHSATPGFEFYTCTICDQDFCNKCFHLVETVI